MLWAAGLFLTSLAMPSIRLLIPKDDRILYYPQSILGDLLFVRFGSSLRHGYFWLLLLLLLLPILIFNLPQALLKHGILILQIRINSLGCN